nr:Friend virus susceptibility protein 1-like [Aotus nancymaae]XP_012328209.1 Friend virus susceptibility protein 1-like [Aotus nancymaae]
MPLFKREIKAVTCDIPEWDDPTFSAVARIWACGTGLSENWDGHLRSADPMQVCETLELVPVEKGKEMAAISRRGWILLSAYRKQYIDRQKVMQEKLQLEKELADLQSKLSMLQCQNFILGDQVRTYQGVAEKAAVHCAQYKYCKRKGKVNAQKVHAVIATAKADWDPDTWDGDIWDDTDDEPDWDQLDEEARKYNPPPVTVQAKPLSRQHQKMAADGRTETYLIQEDFTQQEIQDILYKFSQKPNELLLDWMVRIADMGAGGIRIDHQDAAKFVTVSTNPTVQTAFWDHQFVGGGEGAGAMTSMLELAAHGCVGQYPTESAWPSDDQPWYTIQEGIRRLKQEAMKTAIALGQTDNYLTTALLSTHRSVMVKTAPPAYKHLIITLLLNETGNPIERILEKMVELGDMGDWAPNPPKDSTKEVKNRVTRKEMFQALLKAGIKPDKLDGLPTSELWALYKEKV